MSTKDMTPTSQGASIEEQRHLRDLALRRYDAVLKYLGSEATVFWRGSQLFLVAHAAFLGLIVKDLPTAPRSTPTARILVLIVVALAGLLLCVLWHLSMRAGSGWIDYWKAVLRRLEPEAFDDIDLFRTRPRIPHQRVVAKFAAWLFTVVWSMLPFYVVWLWIGR